MRNAGLRPGGNTNTRLNALRGIALLGVIAIHTSAHFTQVDGLSPVVLPAIVIDIVAHYAVPLFMLLSGIALALRYGNDERFTAGSFYRRRLTKILPPYAVFSLLYMLLFTVEYGPPAASWIPLALLSGSAYYHLWFVALLIQLYLLFPLLRTAMHAASRRGAAAWLLAGALLLQLVWNLGAPLLRGALPHRPLFEVALSERFFLSHLFYFMLGVGAGMNLPRFEQRLLRLPPALLALTVAVLTAGTAWIWTVAIRDYGALGAAPAALFLPATAAEPLLFLAAIALLWQAASRVDGRAATTLARLGELSFPIYLVHVFWQWALARSMLAAGLTAADWSFYPLMFVGTLALSYASAMVFMRLPYGELLTGAPRSPSFGLPRKGIDSADAR